MIRRLVELLFKAIIEESSDLCEMLDEDFIVIEYTEDLLSFLDGLRE